MNPVSTTFPNFNSISNTHNALHLGPSMNPAAEKTAAKVSSWTTFGNIFAAIGDTFAGIRNTFSKTVTVTVARIIGTCAFSLQETASRLAQGAAKNVFKLGDQVSEGLVYLTGRLGRVTEIQEEFKTGAAILRDLSTISNRQITDDNCGLALMSQSKDKIRGKETWTMKAAIGDLRDLQKHFEKANLSETDAAIQMGNIIEDITNGMANLHKAGYVHGDMKPDNILIYKEEKEGKITFHAKISDFGKTRKLDEKKSIVNAGNPRFVPPEGQITSMKGEDAVVALIIVDLLSKPYVKEDANFGVPADLQNVKIREGLKGIMGVWCKKTRAIDNKEGLGELTRGIARIQTQKELKSNSSLSNEKTEAASKVAKDFIQALKLKMKADPNQPDWLKSEAFFTFLTTQLGNPEDRFHSEEALKTVQELKSQKVAPP